MKLKLKLKTKVNIFSYQFSVLFLIDFISIHWLTICLQQDALSRRIKKWKQLKFRFVHFSGTWNPWSEVNRSSTASMGFVNRYCWQRHGPFVGDNFFVCLIWWDRIKCSEIFIYSNIIPNQTKQIWTHCFWKLLARQIWHEVVSISREMSMSMKSLHLSIRFKFLSKCSSGK